MRPPAGVAQDEYGFIVPEMGDDDGMVAAGVAGGAYDVSQSVQSATAAALKAIRAIHGGAQA
jgi:quinone-modifying oxidoreductase subunit QmoA